MRVSTVIAMLSLAISVAAASGESFGTKQLIISDLGYGSDPLEGLYVGSTEFYKHCGKAAGILPVTVEGFDMIASLIREAFRSKQYVSFTGTLEETRPNSLSCILRSVVVYDRQK